jgi:hypothetical protein
MSSERKRESAKKANSSAQSKSNMRALIDDMNRAKPKAGNPDDYYVKIVKYRGRSWGFTIVMAIVWLMMTTVLFLNLYHRGPWLGTIVPIVLIGLMTLAYPPTEDWLYKPWQAIAQQVERHFYDN